MRLGIAFGSALAIAILWTTKAWTDEFRIDNPDYDLSPYTGMTRKHWIQTATYMLDGAFSYIHSLDDPMYFPKQLDKTYPKDESEAKVAKLEGLARTMLVASPLLRENPSLELRGTSVAEYYLKRLTALTDPKSKHYVEPRKGRASQTMLELGAIAMSLKVAEDVLWEPLPKESKDALALTMKSYGEGPSIDSNWMFFNVFILSFLKDKGYEINEEVLLEYLGKLLERYRGEGWYNDAPAYDYYSQWAYQSYGPLWANLYGNEMYPEIAARFIANQHDLIDNYPYMFSKSGKMNMWGRSICYRFASTTPFPLLELSGFDDVNYGWLRYISSSTLLQFITKPEFMENGVPTMGFYGPFAPCVQIYSCRASVYWMGKAFLSLLLPETSSFWSEKESQGPWNEELKSGSVYNRFQPSTGLMITNYPNSGASEMRSWCKESVAKDWQKFRSSENYNKLAYNTEFPWMADGTDGEISMNYATLNKKGEWEVLRLYDFIGFEDGIYRRDAVLETDTAIKYMLADIPLADGILRVDKIYSPTPTDISLGHYSLPIPEKDGYKSPSAGLISNGDYELCLVPLHGWTEEPQTVVAEGLHPSAPFSVLPIIKAKNEGWNVYITLLLWKKEGSLSDDELKPVKSIKIDDKLEKVRITLRDGSVKIINF